MKKYLGFSLSRLNYHALSVSGIILLLDQLTKKLASHTLVLYDPVSVFPFLNWVLAHNTGSAFSFLSHAGGWTFIFFVLVAVFACSIIVVWLHRLPLKLNRLSLGLACVLGGALGNLLDRLLHGYVIDFIDIFYKTWHWPTFNLADTAISLGMLLILWEMLMAQNKT